ncbi:hypothetical protein G7K_5850-t1 [Saitoella complicata NRRL Y-17804]|uniref:Amino acid transporter transmembrane domain-containing protein n=1 Tax=Saitoella complicata (strain BCRC 22490 / CBS 7301 / JCM 7358 / NBRC 10748 / NRRL Y-17804) TaxID=698492 RepID=A0A0E9NPF1_SAICN|nr:hypothetical protein G7K_5850-t1 [Saitoella complicata NRRL Y-17804]
MSTPAAGMDITARPRRRSSTAFSPSFRRTSNSLATTPRAHAAHAANGHPLPDGIYYDEEQPRPPGGWNSIDRFASSWTRSQGFFSSAIPLQLPSSSYTAETTGFRPTLEGIPQTPAGEGDEESRPFFDDASSIGGGGSEVGGGERDGTPKAVRDYGALNHRASIATFGTVGRRLSLSSYLPCQEITAPEDLVTKTVELDDGNLISIILGQSTIHQTICNSINILMGIGILSLPLAIHYAGWILGMGFLAFTGGVTLYTAKVLAKCLDVDQTLVTYADIGYLAFGVRARYITSLLFSLELTATCVALVVLFGDTLHALIPSISSTTFKLLSFLIFLPSQFLPLRILSFSSLLGILSVILLVIAVLVDGLYKSSAPGSLYHPMPTNLWPQGEGWWNVGLSVGMLMAPWSGHAVFPNVYRDMHHPRKFGKAMNVSYAITFLLDATMAVAGYLMFGAYVLDQVSQNILGLEGYPVLLNKCVVWAIAIVPITKMPLNTRPISTTLDILLGLDPRSAPPSSSSAHPTNPLLRGLARILIRVLTTAIPIGLGILVPSFDRIMSLMGAALAMTICVILPLVYHLKIFGGELGWGEWSANWGVLLVSVVLAVGGTVVSCMPRMDE